MTRKAGSIVVDRLRDRVLLGRYFGRWSPGDRLPSVRAVAELEGVDRKTAAAAYRRLEREGLVRVEARSGVYLRVEARDGRDGAVDPLLRLHRQWLESTLESASELGLTSDGVARLLNGVARVEGHRIPVVDTDLDHAALLGRELESRTGLDFGACPPEELPALSGPLRDAPFVVATPAAASQLRPGQRSVPVVDATLSRELLDAVTRAARSEPVSVVVGTDGLSIELGRAVQHGLVGGGGGVRVVKLPSRADSEVFEGNGRYVLWPGTPRWVAEQLGDRALDLTQAPLLSARTVAGVRRQVARTALDYVSRTIVA